MVDTLPDVTIPITGVAIDGTPDGGYALRILKAYRERCNCNWRTLGLPEDRSRIYDLMNEHQRQRAAELDEAIRRLERRDG
jgi:hypothetical protein